MRQLIEFTIRYSHVGSVIEAYCPEFEVGACGMDAREALNRLLDKVDSVVIERYGNGGIWGRLAESDSNYCMQWDPIWRSPVKVTV